MARLKKADTWLQLQIIEIIEEHDVSKQQWLLLIFAEMKAKTSVKLPLSDPEKASLKRHKVKIAEMLNYAPDELEVLLHVTAGRAKEIYALAEFQIVPSIGLKFAEDLVLFRILFAQRA